MRILTFCLVLFVSGCGREQKLKGLLTGGRITHTSGVSIDELRETAVFDLGRGNFSLDYPAIGKGRSKLSIGVSSTAFRRDLSTPPSQFTRENFDFDKFVQIDENTWCKTAQISGTIERPDRMDVDVIKLVNERWIIVNAMSTIDLENFRDFVLEIADSIRIEATENNQLEINHQ